MDLKRSAVIRTMLFLYPWIYEVTDMISYEENEKRKAQGKLFTDTPKGMVKAMCNKTKVDWFNHSWSVNVFKRFLLKRAIFHSFGKSWIEPPLHVSVGKNTSVGDGCYFNFNTVLVDDYKITIGNNVLLAPNVTICTTGHPVHMDLRPNGEMYCAPVEIQDGVWIGSHVTVLPGVTIGENAVIGAGSVVTKDIPPNVIAMGIPCKPVREITERDKIYYYKGRKVDE